ncbi:hypothetical protein NZD89_24800 [Alicyclobacillus fastidiosus]|uniref:Deoxynucleoside kinase domain-containing protein n=1 Tax=Alicyclobacillus fastidiosus TaxID=392011 RepID=A0ABY6ZH51_9BACL|nr:hypothetical protein [Alicyclobacillus fastidiosus]WAH41426.1 hypothetical protein NZD89_24800 [Alicyclobacillus fastidiosus]GMA63051.1 hypothetical protein GCM10025859_34910 [Alicyclobacillus fastidiosus]
MNTKLIIVEGIPGSGKSSTASFIAEYLQSQVIPCELFYEGNLDHPADCESIACLTREQFDELVMTYFKYENILRSAVLENGGNLFLSYGKLAKESDLPEEIITAISKFDVYELPSDKYCNVILQRWEAFSAYQAERNTVVIFECCYLQNALTQLFVRNGEDKEYVLRHILKLSRAIEKLDPILVYLNPLDVNETINKVSKERSNEWLDFVVWYHTQQGYGRSRGLKGTDGYVEVLAARRSLELEILENLPISVLQIDNPQSDWSESHRKIEEDIQAHNPYRLLQRGQ